MGLFFLGILVLIVGIVLGAMKSPQFASLPKVVTSIGAILIVVGLAAASYVSVPAGYRGVLLRFGAEQGVLGEGAHFIIPGMEDVVLMEVRTQRFDTQNTSASSKDLQVVTTDVVVNYHLEPTDAATLYNTVGPDYENRVIAPKVQETLKAVVAQFTAEQLITEREEVKDQIQDQLVSTLAQYHVLVDPSGVSLTNFDFSQQFDQAIEAKQVAEQQAEQQRYTLAQATLSAETAITTAKGEAESNRIKAAALQTAGGQKVLARAWIDKWDGKLPTVVGAGQNTILNLQDLMGSG